jgi:putative transposase
MVENEHSLSIRSQCDLLMINRSMVYYQPKANEGNETIIANRIHEIWYELPFYGYRRITAQLQREGHEINHKRVSRLMRTMNIEALYPKPNCSKKDGAQPHPYLLKDIVVSEPNQAWGTDLTYIRLPSGFVYLVALIDLYSRRIMSWKISITMEVCFCLEMLEDATTLHGIPMMINSDQGSQYTSLAWISALQAMSIQISMDGKGRWADNVYIERLWRTIKQEQVYLYSCETIKSLKATMDEYIVFYNTRRLHQSLNYRTPDEVYQGLWRPAPLIHYSKREIMNNEV